MPLTGALLIGGREAMPAESFWAVDPANGETFPPTFAEAEARHVDEASQLAAAAAPVFRETSPRKRAMFLETIAEEIEIMGEELLWRAARETGLPAPRLAAERARTTGQLRLFAQLLRQGLWVDARIDNAQPDRKPLPRSDLRSRHIALGPVAVFGASNFPLAFSVAGGDTASALAAGCPVIVKGHPAHPGTSELVARAVLAAVAACGLPEGVFSLLSGTKNTLGAALVADPRIKAVGFTGSRAGGMALVAIASQRPEPIPVYAEMSAINPVFLLPEALRLRAEALAAGFAASLTMGAGQFCTNPGLVIGLKGEALDRFAAAAREALAKAPAQTMLTTGIHGNYERGVAAFAGVAETLARGPADETPNRCQPALFAVDAAVFFETPALSQEVFGASSLIIRCADTAEMLELARRLEGQLTASLQMEAGDYGLAARLIPLLEEKAGRILANGWPTGVEVCHAMVHGGPFPATSDSRSTSVGTMAIRRFLRPVCYQDLPDALRPPELQDANPYALPRLVDGKLL